MAKGKLAAYNLGSVGVMVDRSALHMEDGAFASAQNAIPDHQGHEGGIQKRPGFARFNSTAGAGTIKGGIGLAIVLNATSINGTALTGASSRKTFWARATTGTSLGASAGWWTSTDLFATTAGTISSGTPANPRSAQISGFGTSVLAGYNGSPGSGVVINNRFYYAANDYTVNTSAPVIRVFDGTVDDEFLRIPLDPSTSATVYSAGILSMLAVGETIYLTTNDQVSAGSGSGGRVFSLNPSTGALTQLGAKFTTDTAQDDQVPYALEWYMGRLWVGTFNRNSGAGIAGRVYWIRPGIDTAWTLDHTTGDTVSRGVAFLKSFQGQLYAGSCTGGTSSVVEVRTSVGAWSTSLTVTNPITFHNAVVFENNLYTSAHDTTTNETLIKKFDGSSWSTVHTTTSGAEEVALPMCWVENGTLFFGGGGSDSGDAALLSSTDGSSWTSRTANLSAHTGLNCVGTLVI